MSKCHWKEDFFVRPLRTSKTVALRNQLPRQLRCSQTRISQATLRSSLHLRPPAPVGKTGFA